MITFKAFEEKLSMINVDGSLLEQCIEHRIDPLTGVTATINTFLGEKAKAFLGQTDTELLTKLENESKQNCPFCVALEKGTRFPSYLVEEGYIKIGDALGVPNLFSKAAIDAVVIVNHKKHVLRPSTLTKEDFSNTIKVGISLFQKVLNFNSSIIHPVMGMNFLHPGGSSVPHPHFQVHIRTVAYSGITNILRLSKTYREKEGVNYWLALIEQEEKEGKRFIGKINQVSWLTPFAPAHQKEVWGILSGKANFCQLDDNDVEAFSEGIQKVINYYEQEGNFAFTLAFLSAPLTENVEDYFSLQVRICARPAFKSLYSNYDTWFTPKFIGDEVHTNAPEYYCNGIKKFFI